MTAWRFRVGVRTFARQGLRSEASQPSLRPCRASAGMEVLKAVLGTIAAFAPPLPGKRRDGSAESRARNHCALHSALAGQAPGRKHRKVCSVFSPPSLRPCRMLSLAGRERRKGAMALEERSCPCRKSRGCHMMERCKTRAKLRGNLFLNREDVFS